MVRVALLGSFTASWLVPMDLWGGYAGSLLGLLADGRGKIKPATPLVVDRFFFSDFWFDEMRLCYVIAFRD